MVKGRPATEIFITMRIGSGTAYTVFQIRETLLDVPALFVLQIQIFRINVKVAAEGVVSHTCSLQDIYVSFISVPPPRFYIIIAGII